MSNVCDAQPNQTIININHDNPMTAIEQVTDLNSDNFGTTNGNIVIQTNYSDNNIDIKDGNDNSSTKMTNDLLSEATKSIEDIEISETETTIQNASDWMPVQVAEIPISTSHPFNIALGGTSEKRTNILSGHNLSRTIAPKPTVSGAKSKLEEGASKLLIANSTGSSANVTTVKALAKPIQMALVPAPDGNSVIAVPIAALSDPTKLQHLKAKTSGSTTMLTIPVSTTTASVVKGKSIFSGPLTCKVLPATLITSVASSPSATSHVTATATISISPTQTTANSKTIPSTTSSVGGITVVPKTLKETHKIVTIIPPNISEGKQVSLNKDDCSSENPLSPSVPPPLLTQNLFTNHSNNINDQNLLPPTLTPVTSPVTNTSNHLINHQEDKNFVHAKLSETKQVSLEDMDSIMQIMVWKNNIGTLPGSDLKFKRNEQGGLEMITDKDLEEINANNLQENEENCQVKKEDQVLESKDMKKCINCGVKGLAENFIRQGRFCSKQCATLQSDHFKMFIERNSEFAKNQQKRKAQTSKKFESSMKIRQTDIERTGKSLPPELNEQNEYQDDIQVNNEVEDVESQTVYGDSVSASNIGAHFSWRSYLSITNSMAAPLSCFKEGQLFPYSKNLFKVGMKLEGIDPQHPSKFSVLTVADVCGHRLRLHFDGYKEIFDFWVNADSPFIFPCGWCDKTHKRLEPPNKISKEEFNWNDYLLQTKSVAAPKQFFNIVSREQQSQHHVSNAFRIGTKLEAVDKANSALVCVATITDIIDNWLLIHFDGWDDSYDYWTETTSPYIHPINWCRSKGRSLTPPKDYHKSSERFSWEDYLIETKSMAVSPRSFRTRASNMFKVGMKLEAVDKRNPKLIRVATISHRQSHSIKIHFDGWNEKYDYWVDDDSSDIHPVNWCQKTNHPLQPPPTQEILFKKDEANMCPTPGCSGFGHIRGPKYLSHYTSLGCPYTDARLEYELPDRLGNPSKSNDLDNYMNEEECFDNFNHSPSTSESNSNLPQKMKFQKSKGGSRKRKFGLTRNANGSVSPSSESAKLSRPSTPSSFTKESSLHHSLYAWRLHQQQKDASNSWTKHTKFALPGVEQIKACDVKLWTHFKVAEFIDSIPGCQEIGQIFQEEQIDGEALLLLNQDDMVNFMGIKLGPAIKIYNTILVIRDNPLNEIKKET